MTNVFIGINLGYGVGCLLDVFGPSSAGTNLAAAIICLGCGTVLAFLRASR